MACPKSETQRCIIHQLRSSFNYVSYKHLNEFSNDFKTVYKAPNEEESLENLDLLSYFFKYPPEIRTIMYVTNIIEDFHRQLRKITKTKTMLPSGLTLEKILYLASQNAIKKWTQRYRNWI